MKLTHKQLKSLINEVLNEAPPQRKSRAREVLARVEATASSGTLVLALPGLADDVWGTASRSLTLWLQKFFRQVNADPGTKTITAAKFDFGRDDVSTADPGDIELIVNELDEVVFTKLFKDYRDVRTGFPKGSSADFGFEVRGLPPAKKPIKK